MPDETQETLPLAASEPPAETKDTPPPPTYITKEEFTQTLDTLVSRVQGIIEGYSTANRREDAPPPPPPGPSLAEIGEDIKNGDPAAAGKLAALIDSTVNQRMASFKATDVDPLRNTGLASISELAKENALSALDAKSRKRFEKEIDALMAQTNDQARAQPGNWKNAIDIVRSRHIDELLAEERETVMRQANDRRPDSTPRSEPVTFEDGRKVPTLEEYAGREGIDALREKGIHDGDEFVRRLGERGGGVYKSFADMLQWLEKNKDYEEYPNAPFRGQA